jgi:hypothetical protein
VVCEGRPLDEEGQSAVVGLGFDEVQVEGGVRPLKRGRDATYAAEDAF